MEQTPTPRTGTRKGGPDLRGSTTQRHRRKLWLLGAIEDAVLGLAPFGGNGRTVPCVHCSKRLSYATLEADRIIPGAAGGRYVRENVQPACGPCNKSRSANPNWRYGVTA